MIKWLASKFDGGIYTKRQALVIAFSTIGLLALVAYIGCVNFCADFLGIYLPFPDWEVNYFPQPYDGGIY